LKIVHAVCTDAFAGVERHVAVLAAAQQAAGHDVVVIGGERKAMLSALGPRPVGHIGARSVVRVAVELGGHRDADVVAVHMTAAEIAAAVSLPTRDIPIVATRHFAALRGSSSRAAHIVAAMAARRITRQIAVSQYVASRVDGSAEVVLSGVPSEPDGVDADARERVVLVAQRLEAEKRTADALEVFARSGLAERQWRLVVAGEGRCRASLERLARSLRIESSTAFLGRVDDVGHLMRTAGLLLAPRPDEALGLTVLEAMAHGLPVVACAGGGHLETVGQEASEVCYQPGALEEGAAILHRLATTPDERNDVANVLRDAQRRRFTVARQAAATEAVYRSII
jgi:glycosyltransferase involved in cell wall biosynthesis